MISHPGQRTVLKLDLCYFYFMNDPLTKDVMLSSKHWQLRFRGRTTCSKRFVRGISWNMDVTASTLQRAGYTNHYGMRSAESNRDLGSLNCYLKKHILYSSVCDHNSACLGATGQFPQCRPYHLAMPTIASWIQRNLILMANHRRILPFLEIEKGKLLVETEVENIGYSLLLSCVPKMRFRGFVFRK